MEAVLLIGCARIFAGMRFMDITVQYKDIEHG
jgi:hypothetical protein